MRAFKFILALPVMFLMVGFAKMAQYSSVDLLGADLGFGIASAIGLLPVLSLYYWAALKLPKFNTMGAH